MVCDYTNFLSNMPLSTEPVAVLDLAGLYRKMLEKGSFRRIKAWITRHSHRLMRLNCMNGNQHYAGIQTVSIDKIRGTEDRAGDFDDEFNPLSAKTQSRWLSVAQAHAKGISLPAVELVQVGEIYYVRDGHHRISVARAFGEAFIEAEVIAQEY